MMADADTALARLRRSSRSSGSGSRWTTSAPGYSSLSYLSRLPVDILKMDRSFLATEHDGDSSLAAAIIAIGERLGLDVVAEGIETQEQIETLQELGCELGQGFLFARPMPHAALLDYLVDDLVADEARSAQCSSIVSRDSTGRAGSRASGSFGPFALATFGASGWE